MDSTRPDCSRVLLVSPETMRLVPWGEEGPVSYNVTQTLNHMYSLFGYSWKLKTEKHCNKIIIKCVNSTVRPIFNEKVAEKWNLWVREQCTVHGKSQTFRLKKENKQTAKTQMCVWEAHFNTHIV